LIGHELEETRESAFPRSVQFSSHILLDRDGATDDDGNRGMKMRASLSISLRRFFVAIIAGSREYIPCENAQESASERLAGPLIETRFDYFSPCFGNKAVPCSYSEQTRRNASGTNRSSSVFSDAITAAMRYFRTIPLAGSAVYLYPTTNTRRHDAMVICSEVTSRCGWFTPAELF